MAGTTPVRLSTSTGEYDVVADGSFLQTDETKAFEAPLAESCVCTHKDLQSCVVPLERYRCTY